MKRINWLFPQSFYSTGWIVFFVAMFIIVAMPRDSFAQGCSDAGVCTIHGIKPGDLLQETNPPQNQIVFGIGGGKADFDISVFGAHIQLQHIFNQKFQAEVKLTFLAQSGNGYSSTGPSDVFLSGRMLTDAGISVTAGIKLPLQSADGEASGQALPMDYQSSLGTVDLFLGASHHYKNLLFAVAGQIPLTQNKNKFINAATAPGSKLIQFPSTNGFQRKPDFLVRTSYQWELRDGIVLTPGILAIFHVLDDEFTDANGNRQPIGGSAGMTLNSNISFTYSINKRNSLELSFASPFKTRTVRPDGLTRAFVIGGEYRYGF